MGPSITKQHLVGVKYWRMVFWAVTICLSVSAAQNEEPPPEAYIFTSYARSWNNSPGTADGPRSRARLGFVNDVIIDAHGTLFVAESFGNGIRKISPDGTVSNFAGSDSEHSILPVDPLSRDGIGRSARFAGIASLTMDPLGNIYVSEPLVNTIRKITPSAVVTTFAGLPSYDENHQDGLGLAARFNQPMGLAADFMGNVYVVDSGNHVIRKITPDGMVSTFAGKPGERGHVNGALETARFSTPRDIAFDRSGNLYVTEIDNYTVRKISTEGTVTTIAEKSLSFVHFDGITYGMPLGITVDDQNNIFVSYSQYRMHRITPEGQIFTVSPVEGISAFPSASGLTADSLGNLYVASSDNGVFKGFTAALTNSSIIITHHPESATLMEGSDYTMMVNALKTSPLQYQWQKGGTNLLDATNHTYVLRNVRPEDAGQYRVIVSHTNAVQISYPANLQVTAPYTFSTLAGLPLSSDYTDGIGIDARFKFLTGICVTVDENILVTERFRKKLRAISPTGIVTSSPELISTSHTNGQPLAVSNLVGMTAAPNGELILADGAQRMLWRLNSAGELSGIQVDPIRFIDLEQQTNSAWSFQPYGLTVDAAGIIYATSSDWNIIWKIDLNGSATSLAGHPVPGSEDGIGSYARFNKPAGIAVNKDGVIFVADTDNHSIRRITPDGVTTTFAGAPKVSGYADAKGLSARFNSPKGIAIDSDGNIFVADSGNGVIRRITPVGDVNTVAGAYRFSNEYPRSAFADGTGRRAAFNNPSFIIIDSEDNLYVADSGANTVRKGWLATPEKRVEIRPITSNDWFIVFSRSNVSFGITVESVEPMSFNWIQGIEGPSPEGMEWLRTIKWEYSKHTNAIISLNQPNQTDQGYYVPLVRSSLGIFLHGQTYVRVYSPQVLTSVIRQTDGSVQIKFRGENGDAVKAHFELQWRSTLSADSAETWQHVPSTGNPWELPYRIEDGHIIWEDRTAIGQPQRFYRVVEHVTNF